MFETFIHILVKL